MLFRNVAPEVIDKTASDLGMVAYRQSGDPRRAVLRPAADCKYRRVSASAFNAGRKVNAVCWHGHRDFFRALFKAAPAAVVETKLIGPIRYTVDNFESTFEETGDTNIGAPIAPMAMRDACSCPEGAF